MHTRPVSVVYPSSRVEPPPGFQHPDLRRRHNVQPITESWDMFTPDEQRRQREEEVNKKVRDLAKYILTNKSLKGYSEKIRNIWAD